MGNQLEKELKQELLETYPNRKHMILYFYEMGFIVINQIMDIFGTTKDDEELHQSILLGYYMRYLEMHETELKRTNFVLKNGNFINTDLNDEEQIQNCLESLLGSFYANILYHTTVDCKCEEEIIGQMILNEYKKDELIPRKFKNRRVYQSIENEIEELENAYNDPNILYKSDFQKEAFQKQLLS